MPLRRPEDCKAPIKRTASCVERRTDLSKVRRSSARKRSCPWSRLRLRHQLPRNLKLLKSVIARLERFQSPRAYRRTHCHRQCNLFRRLHRACHRLCDAGAGARVKSQAPAKSEPLFRPDMSANSSAQLLFGWLAERIGRLTVLLITVVVLVSMDLACLFAWSGYSMMAFRFVQGIGTGGEVPVQRLHERVRQREKARPLLSSL